MLGIGSMYKAILALPLLFCNTVLAQTVYLDCQIDITEARGNQLASMPKVGTVEKLEVDIDMDKKEGSVYPWSNETYTIDNANKSRILGITRDDVTFGNVLADGLYLRISREDFSAHYMLSYARLGHYATGKGMCKKVEKRKKSSGF
jgi:hypothetical protein